MENDGCVEQKNGGDAAVDTAKQQPAATAPYRYTKEELLDIKELPISNERPECLSDKYDSDGVWDPEKWHASLYPTSERNSPVEGFKKDYVDDRVPLKRRIPDPRERLKEDDLDVILSPQRRSFGGGCQGNAAPALHIRRPISPLENKENETLRLGGARRIGSGRIIAARAFEREARVEKERERERDFKDKRFRRDFGDKRVFSERRRNDSYAEEEPEWFSGGPTSQSETIELIGFDDKILEDDKRRSKRSRKRTESLKEVVECNGGQGDEKDGGLQSTADQEVPHPDVLPEQSTGDFDFNEFFNLEKTMPGLASMIEDVLGEGPVSASRFSQWFSSNLSPSGSQSSSLRSTPHEELEKLAGLEPRCTSPSQDPVPYFTPIQSSECREKVDILELLHKAKIDLKPLLSTLSVNKARLRESSESNTGAVLSLEEVEGEMKGMKLGSGPQVRKVVAPQRGNGTPFMAEHLEEALTGGSSARPRSRDTDMSAFNKLVSSMKASGTLPTHPKTNTNNLQQHSDPAVVTMSEAQVPAQQQKNIFQELLGCPARSGSPTLLGNLLGSSEGPTTSAPLHGLLHKGPSPPLFPQRAPSPDYFNSRLQSSAGFPVGPQSMLQDQFADVHRSISPGSTTQQQMRALSMPVNRADLEALAFQQDLALHVHHMQSGYNKLPQDKSFRNRPQRVNRSPGPGPQPAGRNSPGNPVTSMLSPSFTPTSVIRKMYATKEKSRDEPSSLSETKEETAVHTQDENSSPNLYLEMMDGTAAQSGGVKAGSHTLPSKDQERLRPGSAGHHTPTMVPPGPSSSYPRPIYPVPLLSHVPMVRPPPQLHPNVVQRMLAQPQQLGPALMQAGIFPPHVDLAQLQGLPPTLLGQPLYPLSATGHPLLPPRASTQMQLAVMQQHLQQQRPVHPGIAGPQSQSHAPNRTNCSQQHGGSPPLGLAKWFGSDVLEQPLPSMPAKVISVDELEFRP
ncbi:eukaryotic translation initiation factor 4E transporter isoform X2 [Scomber japonicus]|uniref:eukaryotic translation initiation factor 4E transporter isoform X2 n=1 Tax=Scomber japonicus TaxID=13676 RepID=UPI0023050EAE|nr:eukaryotic translation initiation factor 4E transporter isoform X2 [Scomber japonicus]